MKKSLSLLLALSLVISMAGCSPESPVNVVENPAEVATTSRATVTESQTTTTSLAAEPVATTQPPVTQSAPATTDTPPANDKGKDGKFSDKIAAPSRTVSKADAFNYTTGVAFYDYDIFEFDNHLTRGAVSQHNLRAGSPLTVDYEAYYGINLTVVDTCKIKFTLYNHASSDHPVKSVYVINSAEATLPVDVTYDSPTIVNLKGLSEGLYAVCVEFDSITMYAHFYIASNGVFTCRVDKEDSVSAQDILKRKALVQNKLDEYNIRPDNSLDNSNIMYPQKDTSKSRCDTDLWIALSHEIIIDDNWSDEFKVFAIHEWIIENTSYDMWRLRNDASRAKKYNKWTGEYSLWDMRIGVCCDFANIMAIMLREHGIPTSSICNPEHMWSVVYLDGEWREIDATQVMPYETYTETGDDRTNIKSNYKYYGSIYMTSDIKTAGQDLWTMERIDTGKNIYK